MFGNRKKIALAVVDEIGKFVDKPAVVGDPDFIRAIFLDVCRRSNLEPTETDARKIFKRVQKEIAMRLLKTLVE